MSVSHSAVEAPGQKRAAALRLLNASGVLAALWVACLALVVVLFAVGVPAIWTQMHAVCSQAECPQWQLQQADLIRLHRLGLSTTAWAVSFLALDALFLLTFSTTAALLVRRGSHERMPLFCAFMLLSLGASFCQATRAAASTGAVWSWCGEIIQFLGLALVVLFFFLFPDGQFVPRWTRWIACGCLLVIGLIVFVPPAWLVSNASGPPLVAICILALMLSAIIAQVHRYRKVSTPTQRQQTKWVVGGIAGTILTFAVLVTLIYLYYVRPSPLPSSVRALTFFLLAFNSWRFPFAFIPITVGMAVLRRHLFDLDVIINSTLVYGALTASVIALYVGVVVYLGALFHSADNLLASLIAVGLIAVLVQPMRERLQRRINHLMYGDRDNPYQVLSRLSRQLEETLAPETVLSTIVETTKQALKLPYVAIALKTGGDVAVAASSGTAVDEPLVLPLVFQHEQVGQLLVAPRVAGEGFSSADRRLLHDVAGQAGIAAHAARLTSDLRRSRERLVTAREEERLRIRRDLHDGLGPTLASLSQRLDLAGALVLRDPNAAVALLGDLNAQVRGTIADIRRLVYALRPLTLDEYGLVGAIREHALQHSGSDGLQVSVVASEPLPTLPAAIEVAVYRIALEALTNVVRHAHARTCNIELVVDDILHLEIADDGGGLPAPWHEGVGVSSMRERAEELGGRCTVEPGPGGGTRVLALMPLARE